MSIDEYDVVVAGAGTAGCYAAATIANEGLDVVIVERKDAEEAGHIACGDDALKGPIPSRKRSRKIGWSRRSRTPASTTGASRFRRRTPSSRFRFPANSPSSTAGSTGDGSSQGRRTPGSSSTTTP